VPKIPLNPKAKSATAGGAPLYQLKITLQWSDPAIWRRVVVRADMRLDRLHEVMQEVMPWTDSHMHQFVLGRTFYGVPDLETDMGFETLDERRHTVAELAPAAKKKFIYEYDFGDSWSHEVKLEKILPPDAGFKHPVCLAGANACPPDDCGGIPGYYQMLAILADPENEEHDHWLEWVGGQWNPEHFALAEANQRLKKLKA
jgi:hypothetical protein